MILLDNDRVGCEQCIRGHRAADCIHLEKSLISIKGRGRPSAREKNIRCKLEPNPKVLGYSFVPIESKSGKGFNDVRKFCYHLDTNTVFTMIKVKLGKGFDILGPVDPVEDEGFTGSFRLIDGNPENLEDGTILTDKERISPPMVRQDYVSLVGQPVLSMAQITGLRAIEEKRGALIAAERKADEEKKKAEEEAKEAEEKFKAGANTASHTVERTAEEIVQIPDPAPAEQQNHVPPEMQSLTYHSADYLYDTLDIRPIIQQELNRMKEVTELPDEIIANQLENQQYVPFSNVPPTPEHDTFLSQTLSIEDYVRQQDFYRNITDNSGINAALTEQVASNKQYSAAPEEQYPDTPYPSYPQPRQQSLLQPQQSLSQPQQTHQSPVSSPFNGDYTLHSRNPSVASAATTIESQFQQFEYQQLIQAAENNQQYNLNLSGPPVNHYITGPVNHEQRSNKKFKPSSLEYMNFEGAQLDSQNYQNIENQVQEPEGTDTQNWEFINEFLERDASSSHK